MRIPIRIFMVAAALFMASVVSVVQARPQPKVAFTPAEREAVHEYYKHVLGTLAPASLDRTGFPYEIERELVAGAKLSSKLEKELAPLPKELESMLSQRSGDYRYYKLRRHVILLRQPDNVIADIVKDAGWGDISKGK